MNSIFELILIEWQDVIPASENSVVEIQELHLQHLQNKSTSYIVLVNSSGLRHVSSQIIYERIKSFIIWVAFKNF